MFYSVFYSNGQNAPAPPATGPALPFNSIQWNNAGVFGGDADFTWDNIFKRFEAADNLTPFLHADIAGGTQTNIYMGDTGGGWDNGLLSIQGNGTPTGVAKLTIGTSGLTMDDVTGLSQLNQGNMHIEEDLINNYFLIWNTATRNALVGINKNVPTVALDVHGDALIENATYPSGLFGVSEASADVWIGDFNGDQNSTWLEINDANQQLLFNSTLAQFAFDGNLGTMGYTATNGHEFLGNVGIGGPPQDLFTVYDSSLVTTVLFIDSTNKTQRIGLDFAQVFTDVSQGLTELGDPFGSGNNTYIIIDDISGKIDLVANAKGIQFQSASRGVGIGQSPVSTTPLTIASVPAFANNAAAAGGGLNPGDVYRISVAGTSTLAIVQ